MSGYVVQVFSGSDTLPTITQVSKETQSTGHNWGRSPTSRIHFFTYRKTPERRFAGPSTLASTTKISLVLLPLLLLSVKGKSKSTSPNQGRSSTSHIHFFTYHKTPEWRSAGTSTQARTICTQQNKELHDNREDVGRVSAQRRPTCRALTDALSVLETAAHWVRARRDRDQLMDVPLQPTHEENYLTHPGWHNSAMVNAFNLCDSMAVSSNPSPCIVRQHTLGKLFRLQWSSVGHMAVVQ